MRHAPVEGLAAVIAAVGRRALAEQAHSGIRAVAVLPATGSLRPVTAANVGCSRLIERGHDGEPLRRKALLLDEARGRARRGREAARELCHIYLKAV